ncbi:hypothetical protein J2792_002365 [Novosphingobium capsulatum]|uniref:Uncharacterized protein n=1 Tax=Novosphingobium capsulatum TaxID=13688 RepID=A0ABU1MMD7_9SPHN|nr:hypothetical protein [Novosphingobium capsulatum]
MDLRLQADAKRVERLARAKRAMVLRVDRALVQQIFELSPTDMERLAGEVRAETGVSR